MTQSTRIRIALYSLLVLCALQTWGIRLQARWLQEQRTVIRQLWQDLYRERLHTPRRPNIVRTGGEIW